MTPVSRLLFAAAIKERSTIARAPPASIRYNRTMRDETCQIFLDKAAESLAGAESEFTHRRYNNCANRCYYGSFQAAISALLHDGIMLTGGRTT